MNATATDTPQPFDYTTATLRNRGYVAPAAQQRLRETRFLIAGCGIGASPAVCLTRLGAERFVLVDGDTVDAHNLNRQFYGWADVGRPKVNALRDQLQRINPQVSAETVAANIDRGNVERLVAGCDVVFDTVDFLDLPAILALHSTAAALDKPLFTALSVGFGALVWYFPPKAQPTLPQVLAADATAAGDAATGDGSSVTYAVAFERFIRRLAPYLDDEVVRQVTHVLTEMREGRPCPASQVAPGSFLVGALATSMIHDWAAGGRLDDSRPTVRLYSLATHRVQTPTLW